MLGNPKLLSKARFLMGLRLRVAALLLLWCATVSPALACQWEFAPEPIGGPSAAFIASKMAAEATFIDVAIAEGASAITAPPAVQASFSQALSFRVLKRLKGQSADRFILFGGLGSAKPGGDWGMTHWVDPQGRIYPHRGVLEGQVAMPMTMTSCDPPQLTVAPGRLYVVMREADGRLLGRVPFHPGLNVAGTPIALAGEFEPDDFTRQLDIALARTSSLLPEPASTKEVDRATLVFRKPVSLADARSLLASIGALPSGALLTRGGVLTDYRVGSQYAFPRLLDDAVAFVGKAQTSPDLISALSGRVVEAANAASFDEYEPSFGLLPALIAVAERKEQGTPQFVAIDVMADAAVQTRLARHPSVLRVEPVRRVRGAIASGTLPITPQPPIARSTIYPRLVRLAGKGLPGNAVDGRWALTSSLERFSKVPLTLALSGGVAEATSHCFAPLRGTYSLSGMVLKLGLPEQDLGSCAKSQEFWLLEYLLGSKDFTVRLDGPKLVLQGSAGSSFTFERLNK